jgi:hypothetical protein
MPPGRRAAIEGLTGMLPAIGERIIGLCIMGMIYSLTGVFLVFVQMLYNFMMQLVASSMFFVMMVMMNVSTFLVFFHVVNMMFVLMGMFVSGWVNVFVVLVMFHDVLTFCGDESCRHASCQL